MIPFTTRIIMTVVCAKNHFLDQKSSIPDETTMISWLLEGGFSEFSQQLNKSDKASYAPIMTLVSLVESNERSILTNHCYFCHR